MEVSKVEGSKNGSRGTQERVIGTAETQRGKQSLILLCMRNCLQFLKQMDVKKGKFQQANVTTICDEIRVCRANSKPRQSL